MTSGVRAANLNSLLIVAFLVIWDMLSGSMVCFGVFNEVGRYELFKNIYVGWSIDS